MNWKKLLGYKKKLKYYYKIVVFILLSPGIYSLEF